MRWLREKGAVTLGVAPHDLLSLELDFEADEIRIEARSDAARYRLSEVAPNLPRDFPRVFVNLADREMKLTLPSGREVIVQLGGEGVMASGPVVVLDTNQWIALARSRHAPDKLDERERAAADRLIELAGQGRVTVAVAATNLVEITATDGAHREDVASIMLEVSRGWQMRSALHVRQEELDAAVAGEPPVARNVFTLDPGRILDDLGAPELQLLEDGPVADWLAELFGRVVAVLSVWGTMLEDEKIPAEAGTRAAEAWARSFAPLAQQVREKRLSREETRAVTSVRLLTDLKHEIAQAAAGGRIPLPDAMAWVDRAGDGALLDLPMLGRVHEVLYHRLRSADERWEGNDLQDIFLLACAAAYADVVVGEKRTVEHLRRAEREVPAGACVYRRLRDAVARIDSLIGA